MHLRSRNSLLLRLALVLALILTPTLSIGRWLSRGGGQPVDFAQYYLGGRVVWLGHPEALYPIPKLGSSDNAGFVEASSWRPFAVAEAQRLGMPDATRFIQPPPSAPLFVPLGMVSPKVATPVWLSLLIASQLGIALIAATLCRLCGGSDRAAALVLLAIAVSPGGLQGIQVGNLSSLLGLVVGLNLLLLLRDQQVAAGTLCTIGGVLKYWNVALLPVHLARRQFRAIAAAVVAGLVLVALSLCVLGLEPYRAFICDIAPTLARPAGTINLSLYGLAVRMHGSTSLPLWVRLTLEGSRLALFVVLVVGTYRYRKTIARSDPAAVGAAASWLAWIFVFAPIFWGHYAAVIMPCWGWLAAIVSRARGWPRWLALFAILSTSLFTPLAGIPRLPDPLQMHQVVGLLVMIGLAGREVISTRERD